MSKSFAISNSSATISLIIWCKDNLFIGYKRQKLNIFIVYILQFYLLRGSGDKFLISFCHGFGIVSLRSCVRACSFLHAVGFLF